MSSGLSGSRSSRETVWTRSTHAANWTVETDGTSGIPACLSTIFDLVEKMEASTPSFFDEMAFASWTVFFNSEMNNSSERNTSVERWSLTLDAVHRSVSTLAWYEASISGADVELKLKGVEDALDDMHAQMVQIASCIELPAVQIESTESTPVFWSPQATAMIFHELAVHPAERASKQIDVEFNAGPKFSMSISDDPAAVMFGLMDAASDVTQTQEKIIFHANRDLNTAIANFSGAPLHCRRDPSGTAADNRTTNSLVSIFPVQDVLSQDVIEVSRIMEGSIGDEVSGMAILFVAEAWLLKNGQRAARVRPFSISTNLNWLLNNAAGAFGNPKQVNFICESAGQKLPVGCQTPGLVTQKLPDTAQSMPEKDYIQFLSQIL